MRRPAMLLLAALVALVGSTSVAAAERPPSVAELVAELRSEEATYEDWKPILAAGKPAVAELQKLLGERDDALRATAAVLLYRLGEAAALESLAGLLESNDEAARKAAAAALLAFVGSPVDFDAAAPDAGRAAAVGRWKTWWQQNRTKALETPPLTALYGKILTIDPDAHLAALSLGARHGATRGMRLNVRRGKEFVCLLDVVMAGADGSVARLVELSARTAPQPGDLFFWTTR